MGEFASIVIPNLDSPLVGRTLEALRQQELEPGALEILVVGRDRPGLVPRDGSVRYLETEQQLNAGAARNRGVAAARGERLLFTDADCRPAPDWAPRLLEALERYPVAGGSVQFALDGNRWAVADNIASFSALLPDRPAGARHTQPVGSLNLGLRRQAWQQVGTFDENLVTSEDYDWILRARKIGLEVFFDPAALVEHADARQDRHSLEEHAVWYGRHFNAFRQKHPGVFDHGPTWQSRRRLASTRTAKAWIASLKIFLAHPMLLPGWRAFPGVVAFKMAWYQAILDTWPES